ncbi:hypothetical protein SDC9_152495 [bioreactor metagenome]|uniref:Uncharacterized protein n=1 Tax=bioreactor metagenome TaxID=1076179 RepID=A0A645ET93_9ZZZZ
MPERAVDDVGDRLEAAVRVPVGAPGLTRGVLDLAHLVHVDERVEQFVRHPGEGAADREALALERAGRGRHGQGGALGLVGPGGGDARQRQGVSGHGGHDLSSGLLGPATGVWWGRCMMIPQRLTNQSYSPGVTVRKGRAVPCLEAVPCLDDDDVGRRHGVTAWCDGAERC